MGNEAQGIDPVPIQQNIDLDQVTFPVIIHFVIQGGIPVGTGLQFVKEIIDNFGQRNMVNYVDPGITQVFHRIKLAPLALAQFHHRPHVIIGHHD